MQSVDSFYIPRHCQPANPVLQQAYGIRRCGSSSVVQWFNHEGINYLEQKSVNGPPKTQRSEYHTIRSAQNGVPHDICTFNFSVRSSVQSKIELGN